MHTQIFSASRLSVIASQSNRQKSESHEKKRKKYRTMIFWHARDILPGLKDLFAFHSERLAKQGENHLMIHCETGGLRYRHGLEFVTRQRAIRKSDQAIDERWMYSNEPLGDKLLLSDHARHNISRIAVARLGIFLRKEKKFDVCMAELTGTGQVLFIKW